MTKRWKSILASWRLPLPGCCVVCHAWSTQSLCTNCLQSFAQPRLRCACCGLPRVAGVMLCGRCLCSPPAFHATWAAVDYVFPWAHLIGRFKFGQALELSSTWVDLMLRAGPPPGTAPRLVVPVPLSRERLRQRGYNQAWELARRLAPRLSWPANPELLIKQRHTPEQAGLPLAQRRVNVRGAFALNASQRGHVEGRHVVVVDDVMTTGATANELAQLLTQAGAASVAVWVLGRTPVSAAVG